jgi:hypothetical protein
MAEQLRNWLSDYAIFQIVSLEWMAKEVFPDADIIPMLIFARKERPAKNHKVTVVTGLSSKAQLKQAVESRKFFIKHSSQLDYKKWLELSPTKDWPLEVKTEDLPVLEKLRNRQILGTIAKASFAVKHGSTARVVRPYQETQKATSEIPFLKGQHICAFSVEEADEMIDLSRIHQVSDASIWRDLDFHQNHRGQIDESGLGRYDYQARGLVNHNTPSDTLCSLVSEIYVTLVASTIDPLENCANNSVMVVTPFKYSAHVITALLNSRISRYYAFLLLRSSILLRRRSTWYPRTLKNLPLPDLKDAQAKQIHQLAKEAAALSQGVHLSELDAFLGLITTSQRMDKAGFLGIKWSGNEAAIDHDDLMASKVEDSHLSIGSLVVTGEQAALELLRLALLAADKEEIAVEEIQNVLLPSEAAERIRIADEAAGVAAKLDRTKSRMNEICETIDEIIADGLGLAPRDHETIRNRCREFPLSVTVERPRYVWSPDRKRQARRIYQPGERFK